MNQIQRICAECGNSFMLEARFCPHCGYDTQSYIPVQRSNLPMVIGKAALPILAGAASLAVRAGWKFLQNRMARVAVRQAVDMAITSSKTTPVASSIASPARRSENLSPRRAQRTIHIRSSWAVGDANGVWRQGVSEHTIEIDE
jgi:hypothetical protein